MIPIRKIFAVVAAVVSCAAIALAFDPGRFAFTYVDVSGHKLRMLISGHRLIHAWSIGPEDSFPVQLSLLTRAQLRAAASIPRAIADSRKWLEQHLAEYRRQTATLTNDFAAMVDMKHGELSEIVSKHAEVVKRDALFVSNRLVDANEVAKNIQKNLQSAAAEWNQSKDALARERQRFEKVCQKLDDAINLRGIHWYVVGTLAACVVALFIGHYVWHH